MGLQQGEKQPYNNAIAPNSFPEPKAEVPNMFNEFTRTFEKETAELHSLADRIEQRLHRVRNTNYPSPIEDSPMDKVEPRGNDDLEYQLFEGLESIGRVRRKLQESLAKLESII